MKSAVKIPLLVGEREAAVLDSQSRIANWLYNKLLEQANALRAQYRAHQDKAVGKILYTERGLRDLIPALKEQHPFLRSVYASPLKNAALRLSQAIRAHQDGKHGRRAKAVNWPRFRAWKRAWFSLQYDEPHKGYHVVGRTLTLSLGKDAAGKQLALTLTLEEALPPWVNYDHIRQCRIIKEGHLYSVVFTIERKLPTGNRSRPAKWWPWTPIIKISPMRLTPRARRARSTIPIFSRRWTNALTSSNPNATSAKRRHS